MNQIQEISFGILEIINEICEKNNIEFFLIGGSMLGAIRHKGFIPWDDDIDIGMLREEYEKFLEIAEKELFSPYEIHTYNNTDSHYYYFSHVVDTRFQVKRTGSKDKRIEDVWVDIYPIDGFPKSKIIQIVKYAKLTFYNFMYHLGYFECVNVERPDRAKYQKLIISFVSRVYPLLHINGAKWRNKIDKELRKGNALTDSYLINFIGMKGIKELFPASVLRNRSVYEFEGKIFYGPRDYETYLHQLYGEYMIPPKDSDKKSHPMEILFDKR